MKGDFPVLRSIHGVVQLRPTDRKGRRSMNGRCDFFRVQSPRHHVTRSPRVGTAMFDAFVALALQRRGAVFLSPVLAGLSLEAPEALGGFLHGRACPTQSRRRRAPVFYVPADAPHRLARGSRDPDQTRRLLALAEIYHGGSKTDRLDAQGLLRLLAAYVRGEREICSIVRVFIVEEEDAKRRSHQPTRSYGNCAYCLAGTWNTPSIVAKRQSCLVLAAPHSSSTSNATSSQPERTEGCRSASLDALPFPSNRPCALSRKRQSFGPGV
jgi:hypothetical protein